MKAIVIKNPGPSGLLALEEIEEPQPGLGHLRVRVHATALNRADLLQRRGLYPPPAGVRADVPGLEFAGEVEVLGEGVKLFRPGDRVMGLLPGEGYAEKVVTHERLALPVPHGMSLTEAASIPEAFLTAWDGLFLNLELSMGETVLIHAAGSGVGVAGVQLARAAGARVLGTSGSPEKLDKAKALGLDRAINYREEDFARVVLEETGQDGVDAILDLVGASHWDKNLACLREGGRLLILGLVGGARTSLDLGLALRKRLRILGTVMRTRNLEEKIALTQQFKRQVLPLFQAAKLRPVIDSVFPLEEAGAAHQRMERNQNFGKIVLVLPPAEDRNQESGVRSQEPPSRGRRDPG